MIRRFGPIQFGAGLQLYQWMGDYTDLKGAAGVAPQTLNLIGPLPSPPSNNAAQPFQLPTGGIVLYFRAKPTTAFAGGGLTNLYLDVGYPATVAVPAAPFAINGGSGGGVGGVVTDLALAPADNVLSMAGAASLCPGTAAFGITVTFTPVGLSAWSALTAGVYLVDIFCLPQSMGERPFSQYYDQTSTNHP